MEIFEFIIELCKTFFLYIINYIPNFLKDLFGPFKELGNLSGLSAYEIVNLINKNWGNILTILLAYHTVYMIVGFFATRKFPKASENHKYAVLVAARNEETVIENLLDSIRKQDYPSDLVTVFVVADNCTDKTAEIARANGAICYEREDTEHRTKGFALQFLLERIEEDYGRQSFDGYFIFDADNLLKKDFITRMNEAFDSGEKIVTSYRNTKNFDDNWISASYGLHWLRSIRFSHRARSVFRLATNIQGTGFLFASELVKDGWKYTSLTEDRAFTADAVVQGYHISYNDAAEFYDEQPVSIKVALRQRIRWAKGHILAFVESGWGLFSNIFKAKGFRNKFMSYDMFMLITPRVLFSLARRLIKGAFYVVAYYGVKDQLSLLGLNIPLPDIAGIGIVACIIQVLFWRISWRITGYWMPMVVKALYVFIIEHKRIKKIKWYKQLWFAFMWPLFDIIGAWSTYIALFMKVTWKPIPHESKINIDDVDSGIRGEETEKTKV